MLYHGKKGNKSNTPRASVKPILSHPVLEKKKGIRAFFFSKVDDCNSLLSFSHLQLVQNAADSAPQWFKQDDFTSPQILAPCSF